MMARMKIVIVKRFGQWIGSCPDCVPSDGFVSHPLFESTRQWVASHVDMHDREATQQAMAYLEHRSSKLVDPDGHEGCCNAG